MAKILKFEGGDGREHVCNVGSPAHERMEKDGSFTLLGELLEDGTLAVFKEDTAVSGGGEDDSPVDLSKLNRDGLIAEAAKIGLVIDATDKAQTKKVIIAAIEAKLAEDAAAE